MNVKPGEDPSEDDAGLGLVVGKVTGVLDELRHIDFRNVELADFGNELKDNQASASSNIEEPKTYELESSRSPTR